MFTTGHIHKLLSDIATIYFFVLVPGGLKIWECTEDLIQYFEDNENEINFESKRVLDLGCGAGILGIYAYMKGALVTFQDYVSREGNNKHILNEDEILV